MIIEILEANDCELSPSKVFKAQECLDLFKTLKSKDDSIVSVTTDANGLRFEIFVKCDTILKVNGENKKTWLKALDLCDSWSIEMLDDIFYYFDIIFSTRIFNK